MARPRSRPPAGPLGLRPCAGKGREARWPLLHPWFSAAFPAGPRARVGPGTAPRWSAHEGPEQSRRAGFRVGESLGSHPFGWGRWRHGRVWRRGRRSYINHGSMNEAALKHLTDTLCTRCGLCCDGSLFADAELASGDEASALEVMGLEIEDDDEGEGGLLVQPCGALKGRRCGIYPHRPNCCRTFECRLLQEVKRGMTGVERAKEKIAEGLRRIEHLKELAVHLGTGDERLPLKEHCAEALALSEAAANPAMKRKRAELRAAMTTVERFIRATFLGSCGRARPARAGHRDGGAGDEANGTVVPDR